MNMLNYQKQKFLGGSKIVQQAEDEPQSDMSSSVRMDENLEQIQQLWQQKRHS